MVSDVGNETLPHLVGIRQQLRGLQSNTKEILDHVRPRPVAAVPPRAEPNLDLVRTEASKVLRDSVGEILSSAKIVLFIFMTAILVLGVLSIQNRKEIRRLTERLEAVERVTQPAKR
jgi:hypothetical protein